MRLATIKLNGAEVAAVVTGAGLLPVSTINEKLNQNWATEVFTLIQTNQLDAMNEWYRNGGKEKLESLSQYAISKNEVRYAPLYRHPSKIWGIGLNYVDHAGDLAEKAPTLAPASFAKFDTTIIGPGEEIKIPLQSEKTTGESELAIIFGKNAKM